MSISRLFSVVHSFFLFTFGRLNIPDLSMTLLSEVDNNAGWKLLKLINNS